MKFTAKKQVMTGLILASYFPIRILINVIFKV